jgi:ADP-heptose:LPS heptosyltransferase
LQKSCDDDPPQSLALLRYLVFALQGLGDTLEATPIIAALKANERGADIDVAVTRSGPAQMFRGMPELVSNVIELPYWERGARGLASGLIAHARRVDYAAAFMAYPAAKSPYHFINLCFRARRKFGHLYSEPAATNLLWSYTDLVTIRPVNNVLRNLDLVVAARIPVPERVEYCVPEAWGAGVTRNEALVTIHVGTIAHNGLENRRWPLEYFALLANRLLRDGRDVTLLAGPSELRETNEVLRHAPGARIVRGSLEEAAAHLARSAIVITNDSGIGHLAAGVRTPVVTLFGPTPLTHAPYGATSFPLRPSSCPPCFHPRDTNLYCKLDIDYRCLKLDLSVDFVFDKVTEILRDCSA